MFYGAYGFQPNGVDIDYQQTLLKNAGGQPYAIERAVKVSGSILGDGQLDLTLKENELKNACLVPYQNLIFYRDDDQPSSEVLLNAGSISGVLITEQPSFSSSKGSEYCTERSFSLTATAEYPLPNTGGLLKDWTESLIFGGGQPLYGVQMAVSGPNVRQLVFPLAPYTCTQLGTIVGYRKYPATPPPMFPDALKEAPRVTPKSPKRRGGGYEDYQVDYSYEFESTSPLVGMPNLWVS